MGFDVVVVGSANQDLTILTPHHPEPGETVIGKQHRWGAGGKGANQAVAASRLGARTAFVGMLGDDESGKAMRASLESENIDISALHTHAERPTGLAVITVDESGENSIVVSPGANMALEEAQVSESSDLLGGAKVVLAQLEIPIEAVITAAGATSGIFCLNPAPARKLPTALMKRVDVLIPNRGELATLTSTRTPESLEDAVEAARSIAGPGAVVITLGGDGAVVIDSDDVTPIPPADVHPVDTTGAGDAFCGALAEALGRGCDLVEAARWAVVAGGLATTRHGAQDSMPTRAAVEAHSGT